MSTTNIIGIFLREINTSYSVHIYTALLEFPRPLTNNPYPKLPNAYVNTDPRYTASLSLVTTSGWQAQSDLE